MGKTYEQKIIDFSGGITNDPRKKDTKYAQMVKHFDAHTFQHKLVPHRSWESGDNAAPTSQKQNFCVGLRTGTTYSLFSLGYKSGAATAEILYKDLASDLDDAVWASTANNQSGGGAADFKLFIYYKKTGRIYGASGGQFIWAYDPGGSTAWDASSANLTSFTTITQGLVHSKDDILYVGHDNKISRKNGANAWDVACLTLPTHYSVTSLSERGNYLAIACSPVSGVGNSRVFLWDRDTSLATVTESIDWGEGNLHILEELDGILVGISYVGGSSISFNAKIVFRYYSGDHAVIFREFHSDTSGEAATDLPLIKQKINNHLYFQMTITLNGTRRQGIWKAGKNIETGLWGVTMDREPVNDSGTPLTTGDTLHGFFIVGDYCFISYLVSSGGVWTMSKTDDSANYNVSSEYVSIKDGEPRKEFQLVSAGVTFDKLPAAGQVILKYRINGATAWTQIFKHNTDDTLFKEATQADTDDDGVADTHFARYREIEFQILSTGGAIITGLWWKYIDLSHGLTDKS